MNLDHFTDSELLLIVLTLFYLAECLVWLSHDSIGFVVSNSLSTACRFGGLLLRNSAGGFAWTSLFPDAYSFLTQTWPVAISPDGLHSHVPQTLNRNGQADSTDLCFSWSDLDPTETDEKSEPPFITDNKKVLVQDKFFIKSSSATMARFLARSLNRLHESDDREKEIDRLLAQITDTTTARAFFDQLHRKTRFLRSLCFLLFLYTFIAGVTFLLFGPSLPASVHLTGWYVLGIYIFLWWLTAILAFFVHRSLARWLVKNAPDAIRPSTSEMVIHLFSSLCVPLSAIRSVHAISREWLSTFHPLTVAAAIMPKERFLAFARRTLLDARHPMDSPWIEKTAHSESIQKWFAARLESALVRLVESEDEDPTALTAPPKKESHDVLFYCPRCGDQYQIADGVCLNCHGVPLQKF